MPANPKVSARLQSLIDQGVLDRLSVSFSSFCLDQMKDWELLFPAERGYFERLFGLLDRSNPEVVERLFAPVREIERKMGVSDKTFPKGQFTLEQVDFLNRNPYYAEWRGAITRVFAQLDPLLDAEIRRGGHARLVIAIAPSQLPADPERMWTRFEGRGKRIALEMPERAEAFVPLLLTGEEHGSAPSIAELFAAGKKGGAYASWIVEAGVALSRVGTDSGSVVKVSYQSLEQYRQRLMKEVQSVVDAQDFAPFRLRRRRVASFARQRFA